MESRVREIFEEQGFHLERSEKGFTAERNDDIKEIQVFSSENWSEEQIMAQVEEDAIVFVDSVLADFQERLDNQVSVLEKKQDEDVQTPSYEMIGDIALINELPDLSEEEAVEAIRHYEPDVQTILLKKEGLSGEYRVGDYRKLYGEKTETVHREFGCRFKVDPTKMYYSERFSTERNRVVSQIEDGEKVLVMFAGVGPYAVMAARNANPEKVVAIEKNPEACKYLKENIKLNSVEDIVEARCGDVEDILPELGRFDRIVMPLPGKADEYLDLAVDNVFKEGIIHYYRFIEDEDWVQVESEIEDVLSCIDFEILDRVVCGDRGPGVQRVCVDVMINQ